MMEEQESLMSKMKVMLQPYQVKPFRPGGSNCLQATVPAYSTTSTFEIHDRYQIRI